MKKLYLTLLIFPICIYAFGQISNYGTDNFNSIREEFYENYSDTIQDTNYLKTIKQFKRWEQFWGPRLTKYNSFDSITHKRIDVYAQMQTSNTYNDHSNWLELGPNTNGLSGIGRIDAIEIDPANSNIIYAGSPSGGLWKTIDGGLNWSNISDNYFTSLGVSSIAVASTNSNTIYAATGDVDSETTYSHGIYRSNDGGITWQTINTGLINENTPHFTIGKIILHPTNTYVAFVATSLGIYKCTNINDNTPQWTKVYPVSGNEYVRNIGFNPNNSSTLYAVGIDIISSVNDGQTWNSIATADNGLDFSGTPWPNALNGLYIQMMNMAIDPNGNYIYVNGISRNSPPPYNWNTFWKRELWRYDILNDVWSDRIAIPGGNEPPHTVARTEMVVSPLDSEHLYAGGVYLWESIDGGVTWIYYGAGYIHADYHEFLFDPNDNNILFVGTDGGVWKIDIQNHSSTELNNGLGISTMYNMASSIIDPYQVLTGSQDCGINYFKNNQWSHEITSDGFQCYMDEEDIDIMYATKYYPVNGMLKRSNNDANDPSGWTTISTDQDNAFFGASLVAHPEKTYELYQARQSIWKIPNSRTGSSSNWVRISDFHNKFPFMSQYSICYALEIAPTDGNVIYTSFIEASSWVIDFNEVKLLKTTIGGGLNSNDWIDITPDPYNGVYTYFITDIAVSDQNPDEIWICYSGYIEGTKVKHYDGANWNNYNDGLPNVPLNTIVYYEGSDDMLFVGTDIGVYYRDNSMNQWMPFTKDLPSVIVNWLEINENNSTLRAATYGRGLWEADLLCALPGEEVFINDNTVWDTPILVRNTITINAGAKLTITDEVSLTSFAKIIVKPGAKLIIDGGTLTNACSEVWQGIEIWGNSNAHQYPDANANYQQGYVELKNDAVIENAYNAVTLWKPDDWQSMGGILIANDVTFRNNRRAVEFMSYQNFDPASGDPRPNKSKFVDCVFETDEDYFNTDDFHAFVSMWKVDGIKFYGCDFEDKRVAFQDPPYYQAVGIWTIDANFYVLPDCSDSNYDCWSCPDPSIDFSSFTGLNIAVYSSQERTNNSFVIDHTKFVNNLHGIYNAANNYASCIRSDFEIGTKQLAAPYYIPLGIYNYSSTGFTFNQNDFTPHASLPPDIDFTTGICCKCINEDVNTVYNNKFIGLGYGNIASGDNHNNYNPYLGLTYKCNHNSANLKYDFYIYNGEGIATYQGTEDEAAGNTFCHNTTPDGSDFANLATWPVNYFYYEGNPDEDPLNTIGVWKKGAPENLCEDRYIINSNIRLSETEKDNYRQQYYDNKIEYDNTKALYESLKDGGSTPDTKFDIEISWPDETWELRAQLLADSPHLSKEVLMAAADKTDVLPHTIMFEICMANPEEMRNKRFLEYLATKDDPMPQYMIDNLRNGADEDTYKSVLQNEMAGYAYLWGTACNNLIRDIVLDSIGINRDSLRLWLSNKENLKGEYEIVDSYLAEDDLTNALTHLNNIPNNFELSDKQLEEYNYFHDLKTTIINAQQQGRNIFQLDSLEILDLAYIADTSKYLAGVQAQSILNFVYGYSYFDLPDLQEPNMKSGQIQNHGFHNKAMQEENHYISAHPNPASQWVAIDYTLPYPSEKATIIIYNAFGKIVKTFELKTVIGQSIWDTRNIPSGIYFYSLQVNGAAIDKRKLIISK